MKPQHWSESGFGQKRPIQNSKALQTGKSFKTKKIKLNQSSSFLVSFKENILCLMTVVSPPTFTGVPPRQGFGLLPDYLNLYESSTEYVSMCAKSCMYLFLVDVVSCCIVVQLLAVCSGHLPRRRSALPFCVVRVPLPTCILLTQRPNIHQAPCSLLLWAHDQSKRHHKIIICDSENVDCEKWMAWKKK